MLPHGPLRFRVTGGSRGGAFGRASRPAALLGRYDRRCLRRRTGEGWPLNSSDRSAIQDVDMWETSEGSRGAEAFDMILVGSGNGACGFLSRYLEESGKKKNKQERILVLEEGVHFYTASDITHQINWTRSYAQADIYKLHKAETPDGRPIITGRACVMGGGGSITYTMIHEGDDWLEDNVGETREYWADLKQRLNERFRRSDPSVGATAITKHVIKTAKSHRFHLCHTQTGWIPSYPDVTPPGSRLLHPFPTQFNEFGQRVHSGISLVNWFDCRLKLLTLRRVDEILTSTGEGGLRAKGVRIRNTTTGQQEVIKLSEGGRLILCAGSQSPQLLLKHASDVRNNAIGEHVTDHVLLPLGIYVVDKKYDPISRDNYVPVFATTLYPPRKQTDKPVLVNVDFFAGNFQDLWYFLSHLLLSFTPNFIKKRVADNPSLFLIVRNTLAAAIRLVNSTINFLGGGINFLKGRAWAVEYDILVPIIKFNTSTDGKYSRENAHGRPHITLGFFTNNDDEDIARDAIKDHLPFLNELGKPPNWLVKFIFQFITKIPYEEREVDDYVRSYGKNHLLSEQHLSGGCLFGEAIDKGKEKAADTGKVKGTQNIYVADLSTVPLPRVSPQMTAYLIGFHVANKIM